MPRIFRLPSEFALHPGARRLVEVDGHKIALFNVDGTFYAVADKCPHHGASMLEGKLEGCILECALHGLGFDLRTGAMRYGGLIARTYPVALKDGLVEITLPE